MPARRLKIAALCCCVAAAEYRLDSSWRPAFPEGSGTFSAVAFAADSVFVGQRSANYSHPILVFDRDGTLLRSFGGEEIERQGDALGNHGLAVQPATSPMKEGVIWVMDFFGHGVYSYSLDGTLTGRAGAPGAPSCDADKFANVADATFREGRAFFADGDGGANNRVERWDASDGTPAKVEWVSPKCCPGQRPKEEFNSPHGIAFHEPSDSLLIADRENDRIAVMDPETGLMKKMNGTLRCDGLGLGAKGRPFGVRTLTSGNADLLFVAVANNPQDGKNQFFHVVDMSGFSSSGSCKSVLQTIPIDPSLCHTPHLMGVDEARGDVYLACVAEPNSNVLRFVSRLDDSIQQWAHDLMI